MRIKPVAQKWQLQVHVAIVNFCVFQPENLILLSLYNMAFLTRWRWSINKGELLPPAGRSRRRGSLFRLGITENINKDEPVPQGDHRERAVRVFLFVLGVLQCWVAKMTCYDRTPAKQIQILHYLFYQTAPNWVQRPSTGHGHMPGARIRTPLEPA